MACVQTLEVDFPFRLAKMLRSDDLSDDLLDSYVSLVGCVSDAWECYASSSDSAMGSKNVPVRVGLRLYLTCYFVAG